ncbi:hypothetical protein G9A89_021117 [Geosiphon pyriformis]|nr:hypothetical protein G9A89_021117 [Geosiphon pyriformis]
MKFLNSCVQLYFFLFIVTLSLFTIASPEIKEIIPKVGDDGSTEINLKITGYDDEISSSNSASLYPAIEDIIEITGTFGELGDQGNVEEIEITIVEHEGSTNSPSRLSKFMPFSKESSRKTYPSAFEEMERIFKGTSGPFFDSKPFSYAGSLSHNSMLPFNHLPAFMNPSLKTTLNNENSNTETFKYFFDDIENDITECLPNFIDDFKEVFEAEFPHLNNENADEKRPYKNASIEVIPIIVKETNTLNNQPSLFIHSWKIVFYPLLTAAILFLTALGISKYFARYRNHNPHYYGGEYQRLPTNGESICSNV